MCEKCEQIVDMHRPQSGVFEALARHSGYAVLGQAALMVEMKRAAFLNKTVGDVADLTNEMQAFIRKLDELCLRRAMGNRDPERFRLTLADCICYYDKCLEMATFIMSHEDTYRTDLQAQIDEMKSRK